MIEIEGAGLEQIVERADRQMEFLDRVAERGGDRRAERLFAAGAADRLAPPLQANLAGRGLAHDVRQPGDFVREGVEREKMRPRLGRREETGEPAVAIVFASQGLAMGVSLAEAVVGGHGGPYRRRTRRGRAPGLAVLVQTDLRRALARGGESG